MPRKKGLIGFIQEISSIWTRERHTVIAAALAYYSMFAIAPIIYISLTIAGIFVDQLALADQIFQNIASYLGPEITGYIQEAVVKLSSPSSNFPVLGTVISFIAIIYAASGLFYQLQYSLNMVWRIPTPEKGLGRVLLKQRLISLVMVGASGLLLILALMVFGILAWLESRLKVGNNLALANPLAAWALISLSFSLIYKYIPDTRVHWRDVLPGAAIAGALITLVLLLFSVFFRIGSFSTAFAATSAVVMVLIGMNLFANIFLLGAVVGRTIQENRTTEVKEDLQIPPSV
jgi:membrane protein